MKRFTALALSMVMMLAALAGCSGKTEPTPSPTPELTAEERTQLYADAITAARSDEENEYNAIITSADDMAELAFSMLGITAEDMEACAISVSMVNIKAYGIAVIKPAEGSEDTVKNGMQGFIDTQKANFERYLVDQYEIANSAKLETLEDGTVIMVMCENSEDVYNSIVETINAK